MEEELKEYLKNENEADDVREFYRKMGLDEHGIDAFFLEVVRTNNSIKVGNVTEIELGKPQLPIRTLLDLSRDCSLIPSMSTFSKNFKLEVEDIEASSLSKEGFLLRSRVTQRKELLDGNKKKKVKFGLFGKKKEEEED